MENIMMHIAQGLRQYKWLLLVLCAIVICKDAFVRGITKYICPITSGVEENSWLVLGVELLAVAIVYAAMMPQIKKEREIWVSRCGVIVILLLGYLWFRIDKRFVFLGFDGCVIKYADWVCLAVVLTEAGLILIRKEAAKKLEKQREAAQENQSTYAEIAFREETPTEEDGMLRETYANQLVNKIAAGRKEKRKGALTILLNEHYGVGKTSFMLQVQQKAQDRGIDVCWFKPWMYDKPKAMILNFIQVLEETIGTDDKPLQQMFSKYAKAWSAIEKFEWISMFQGEDASVESQFEEIKTKLQEKGQPVIVLIDDIDRLQSKELLRMLQVVRNMGDFPHINYVIAADKGVLISRLAEAEVAEPEEYLKKFFNLEISFPADDHQLYDIFNDELSHLLQSYSILSTEVLTFVNELKHKSEIFANLREVKRYVNLLDYTLSIIRVQKIQQDVSIRDVAGICLIQHLDSALYHVLRDHRGYILEANQRGALRLKKDYTQYFANREDTKKLNEWLKKQAEENGGAVKKAENNTNTTSDTPINYTVNEVLAVSRPLHIEIIGSILDVLFSDRISDSKIGVKYETEYFKYFAFRYQDEGMSNQDFVKLMGWKRSAYATGVNTVVEEKRIPAFRQKMQWYIQNEKYERLDVLKRLIIVAKKDYKQDDDEPAFKLAEQDYFTIHYGSIVLSLFRQRKDEAEEHYQAGWEELREWLIHDRDYRYRVFVLGILHTDIPYDDYIFGDKKMLNLCISESAVNYINHWKRDLFNPEKYEMLNLYRRICIGDFNKRIIDEIGEIYEKVSFWAHLVQIEGQGLAWNEGFINAVLDGPKIFKYYKNIWAAYIPQEWRFDLCERFALNEEITDEMIQTSVYLRYAQDWWKKEMENKQ